MRISDWSSDVCSSDLLASSTQLQGRAIGHAGCWVGGANPAYGHAPTPALPEEGLAASATPTRAGPRWHHVATATPASPMPADHRQRFLQLALDADALRFGRSEAHTSELQSLSRLS